MKALKILTELLKYKYKNQPLFFGVQKSIEDIENIHDAIDELEAFENRTCKKCMFNQKIGWCDAMNIDNVHIDKGCRLWEQNK